MGGGIKIEILKNIKLIIVTNMVESKAKVAVTKAKIAHKLARYFRATPVHLTGVNGASAPSTAHLSTNSFTQLSAVPPSADSEIVRRPGTLLTTRSPSSSVPPRSPAPPPAVPPCSPDPWSSCSLAPTVAAEWSC